MAFPFLGAGDLDSEKLSSEFLQCPLCLERFTSPKVLPCQHTFCLSCLRQYVGTRGFDNVVPCPLCKEMTIIPGNDVSNLKNNFMIVSLLHFVETSKVEVVDVESTVAKPEASGDSSSDARECGACVESTELTSFCEMCQLWLCARCSKAHSRVPSTATHSLLSNEEIDKECKDMADKGEKTLSNMQQETIEKHDALCLQIQQLPENITAIKKRIKSTAEEACRAIAEKEQDLLQRADSFLHNQAESLSHRLSDVEDKRKNLDEMLELLNNVKISNDAPKNRKAIKTVESYLTKKTSDDTNAVGQYSAGTTLAFTLYSNNLTELKNIELGLLRTVQDNLSKCTLYDRPLGINNVSSLAEREYISGLAINRFADKFVVANNSNVLIFKPDSKLPKPFLSPLSERMVNRPWSVAYCEEDRRVFITEAGAHEGQGAIISYTHDGKFSKVIATGLTLPRGIAVRKSYIYVCDQIDKCVYIFNGWGKITKLLKKTPDGKCIFHGPMFLSVGKSGRLAVSDSCSSVKVFDKDCVLLFTYYSNYQDSEFWDVLVLQDDTVIICDWKHGLHKLSSDFTSCGLISAGPNLLREPSALASLENSNCIYVGTCGGEIFSVI